MILTGLACRWGEPWSRWSRSRPNGQIIYSATIPYHPRGTCSIRAPPSRLPFRHTLPEGRAWLCNQQTRSDVRAFDFGNVDPSKDSTFALG